jgi:hypothetical protein
LGTTRIGTWTAGPEAGMTSWSTIPKGLGPARRIVTGPWGVSTSQPAVEGVADLQKAVAQRGRFAPLETNAYTVLGSQSIDMLSVLEAGPSAILRSSG